MFKYSYILVGIAIFLFTGCGGNSCCKGVDDSIVKQGEEAVNPAPTAIIISEKSECSVGESLVFDGLTSSDDGTISNYSWSIKDEEVSTNPKPSLICKDLGVQTVCLIVTDNDGKNSTKTCQSITVKETPLINPIANITGIGDTYTIGEVIQASGVDSSDADGEVQEYLWSFGTQTQTVQNPTFTILTTGEQEICLTVTDNDKLSSEQVCTTVTGLTKPNERPIADFNPDNQTLQCTVDETLTLNATTSSDSDGTVNSYQWNPDTLKGLTPVFACDTAGVQQICLSVTDDGNLTSNELCKTVTISKKENLKPKAIISNLQDECTIGEQILPDGSLSSDEDGNVTVYTWSVNGTSTSTEQKPIFLCDIAGEKEICLTVQDNDAANSDQICHTLTAVAPIIVQPQTLPPIAVITHGIFDSSGFNFDCSESYDQDDIDGDQTPQNDKNIISNHWNVMKYHNSGFIEGPHGGDSCVKWIGTPDDLDYMEVTLSVVDDDGEESNTTITYTFSGGILTP